MAPGAGSSTSSDGWARARSPAPTRPGPPGSTRSPCERWPPTPESGRTCSPSPRCPASFSLHPVRHLRALPPALRAPARLPGADRRDRGRVHLREHRPRRLRGVHEGAPRAGRPRRAAADARGPRAALRGGVEADRLPRRHVGADLPPPDRHPARQLLAGRARHGRHGAPRGARLRAPARPRRRHARRADRRLHRPDRPPAVGRHRGARLQDRQARHAEDRRREPPALDLRPGLPRRARAWARPSGSPSTTPRPPPG